MDMNAWKDKIRPEEWKDIPEYSGYQISNKGRIRSIRLLKPYNNTIVLVKDGVRECVLIDKLIKSVFK